jgi:hypothetical protein
MMMVFCANVDASLFLIILGRIAMKQKTKKIKGGIDLKVDFSELKEVINNLTNKPQPKIFRLESEDVEKLNEWDKKHKKVCKLNKECAIGGRLSFIFIPTGLGIDTIVQCACGEQLNLTDVSDW